MCGLFGYCYYGAGNFDGRTLGKKLGEASVERGHHATGISYNRNNKLYIKKAPVSAYDFDFNNLDNVNVMMGHTRYTTQGSEKDNFNNHPFRGKAGDTRFALAHNGVIYNDYSLQLKHSLPDTNIKTDSYVAVQLLEKFGGLTNEKLKKLGEQLYGMFTLSILDMSNNLYFIKGDSPLHILHFKDLKLYVYASTKEILFEAIMGTTLNEHVFETFVKNNRKRIELISPAEGEILSINTKGIISKAEFDFTEASYTSEVYCNKSYIYDDEEYYAEYTENTSKNINDYASSDNSKWSDTEEYLETLLRIAENMNIKRDDIHLVLDFGYSLFEVEHSLFDGTFKHLVDEVCKIDDDLLKQYGHKEDREDLPF